MYRQTTRSITVTVTPSYLADQSSPGENHFVWAYNVRIENGGQQTVQLLRRHWKITDALGR
ncbi:MAG TPA: ApaG domain, partial [Rhodospirillaceae bacterium]|nr:ApaG domain [Rhodospirillaceae bacterium]